MTRTAGTTTQPPFTLDTSGKIFLPLDSEPWRDPYDPVAWPDLDPFTQGYIEALLGALDDARPIAYRNGAWGSKAREVPIRPAFSWVSPEALAVTLRDCADARRRYMREDTTKDGALFWSARTNGDCVPEGFPPLAPYVRDDCKVDLKDVA